MTRKIRAVIDTNLFISGIFGKNTATADLQELWVTGEIELATSLEIMKELGRVFGYPRIKKQFSLNDETVRHFFRLIFRKAAISRGLYQTARVADDPDDDKFLACALETQADYIVSGDNHLLSLKHYHGIQIVDAKAFIQIVKGE